MKNLIIALVLLVSLQSFSNNAVQSIDLQDEISYCIDIDVGVTVEVQSLKFESLKSKSQMFGDYAIMYRQVELAINVETETIYKYYRLPRTRCKSYIPSKPFNTFVGAGGLPGRQPLST